MQLASPDLHDKDRANWTRASKSKLGEAFRVVGLSAILFVASGAQISSSQSASFAFGQGGFDFNASGEQLINNECQAGIEDFGLAECNGYTNLKGAWSSTQTNASTKTGTELNIFPGASVGAAAMYNNHGFASTVTHCTIAVVGGTTICGTGAYASPDGAFAATTIGSTR